MVHYVGQAAQAYSRCGDVRALLVNTDAINDI